MIPSSFLETLLARVDIVEVIGQRLKLKKSGANYFACCPFHGEKTPSFSVSPSKQFYHCFGCGAHGSAITFLMQYEGLSFREAVQALAQEVGLTVPNVAPERSAALGEQQKSEREALLAVMARAAEFYQRQLPRSPEARQYLERRGVSAEIIARFGLGYAPDDWQALATIFPHYQDETLARAGLVIDHESGRRYDRFRHRIIFPIHDRKGRVIALGGRALDGSEPKYLNSPETPLFEKGRELYALPLARDGIRTHGYAIVVEGYMDVLALHQAGLDNAVAVLGTAATAQHVKTLLAMTDTLVFCFDGDEAGRRAAWRALENALEVLRDDTIVRFAFLPEGEDPDTLVRQEGAAAFAERLKNAPTLTQYLLDTLTHDLTLDTAEGRARLAHAATPLIARLRAPLLRQQLQSAIRERTGLSNWHAPDTNESQNRTSAPPSPSRRAAMPSLRRPPRTLGAQLLRHLLASPQLAARVPVQWLDTEDPETRAAIALIDAIEHGEVTIGQPLGAWLEHFRDHDVFPVLQRHAAALLAAEAQGETLLVTDFDDLLQALMRQQVERELQELTQRARSGTLSRAEQQRLMQLLREQARYKAAAGATSPPPQEGT